MLKKVVITVLILALIGVGTGAYMWFKPPPKVEDSKGIVITAVALTKEYNTNEKKADTSYLDKAIEVSGVINGVNKNQDSGIVVTLESGDPMGDVQCTMREKNVNPQKGKDITIKGFCRGNNMGVVLNDCIIK
jgi:uncharacterized protein YpmB